MRKWIVVDKGQGWKAVVNSALLEALESSDTKRQRVTEHVRIDDDVIKNQPFDAIAPIWYTADIYDGPAEYNRSLSPFTREQRSIFAVMWYKAEVNNGGHCQFYDNPTGIVWKDALVGFRELGLPEVATILEESVQRMGGNPSAHVEARRQQMDELQPRFDDLDERFYELERQRDLNAIIQEYIVKHCQAFHFEGDVTWPEDRAK